MNSISSIVFSPLLLVLFLARTQESRGQVQTQAGMLDFVPEVCMPQVVTDLLPCVFNNICANIIPSQEEVDAILDGLVVESCADVEENLCPITTRCSQCKELADELFKCIIVNNENEAVTQNITDLVNSCSLECAVKETDSPTKTAETDAPVAAPTEAPGPDSSTPTDAPKASEATEAPTDSGAVNMMTSSLAILSGVISFVLGW